MSINKASIVWAGYCGKDRPDRVITTNYVRSEAYAVYTEMYGEVLSRFYRNAWATIQRHKDNQTAKRAATKTVTTINQRQTSYHILTTKLAGKNRQTSYHFIR